VGATRSETGPSLEKIAYTIPEFCFRNSISRPTYHRLRSQGLGPTEMRLGLNLVRISAAAELEWQQCLQKPQRDVEARALERAVKAGSAAIKSPNHISKKRAAKRDRQSSSA
jgi:predicted DNA-binding transcriptional regulator AlpA